MSRKLTIEDIIETTGISDADQLAALPELEILFLSFDEIASLHRCTGLRKLSFIDNGIKKLSNLNVLGNSLVSLCVCDQEITVIENLNLPNLRELFLHRNLISHISGLSFCPRIKKLWLFQNKLRTVAELNSVPELEELFLQGNSISSLEGLIGCGALRTLALAGNPISSISEVLLLENIKSLRSLSFTDIHFGKCPVANIDGFQYLILSKFRGLSKFDGVEIRSEAIATAGEEMERQLRFYNDELQAVEDEYRQQMQIIEGSFSARESHLHLLEKEMTNAVKELQAIVVDGRQTMLKQLKFQETLIDKNFGVLKEKIEGLTYETKSMLLQEVCENERMMTSQTHILKVLERLYVCDLIVTRVLAAACKAPSGRSFCMAYQSINHNSVDFQMISKSIIGGGSSSSGGGGGGMFGDSNTDSSIELARLYRILYANNGVSQDISLQSLAVQNAPKFAFDNFGSGVGSGANSIMNNERVYMLVTVPQLHALLTGGWSALSGGSSTSKPSTSKGATGEGAAKAKDKDNDALNNSNDDYLYDSFEESTNLSPRPVPIPPSKGKNGDAAPSTSLLMSSNAQLLLSMFASADKTYCFPESSDLCKGVGDVQGRDSSALDYACSTKKEKEVLEYILRNADSILSNSSTDKSSNFSSLLLKREDDPFQYPFYVLLSCTIDIRNLNIMSESRAGDKQAVLPFPTDMQLRSELLNKLMSNSSLYQAQIRNFNGSSSSSGSASSGNGMFKAVPQDEMLYSIPTAQLDTIAGKTNLKPEFVGLVLVNQVPSNKGSSSSSVIPTIRVMENVLEHVALPNYEMEKSSFIVKQYEESLAQETRYYLDKLLEEINENEAMVLMQSNEHIMAKENALRKLKEDVEKERKLQESLLRDIKYQSNNAPTMVQPPAAGARRAEGNSARR